MKKVVLHIVALFFLSLRCISKNSFSQNAGMGRSSIKRLDRMSEKTKGKACQKPVRLLRKLHILTNGKTTKVP